MTLGRRMYLRAFVLEGVKTRGEWRDLVNGAVDAIDMQSAGEPAVWTYPLPGGAGGVGDTIVKPMTTSFIALDTWPDLRGAYLVICSCQYFMAHTLRAFMRKQGIKVRQQRSHFMGIGDGEGQ